LGLAAIRQERYFDFCVAASGPLPEIRSSACRVPCDSVAHCQERGHDANRSPERFQVSPENSGLVTVLVKSLVSGRQKSTSSSTVTDPEPRPVRVFSACSIERLSSAPTKKAGVVAHPGHPVAIVWQHLPEGVG
jgi:hypothetical protein